MDGLNYICYFSLLGTKMLKGLPAIYGMYVD